jgi:hypothetical protein
LGRKSDNCWVKTDWLDAGEGAETQIGIDMKILIKLMRLLYLKRNKTTP